MKKLTTKKFNELIKANRVDVNSKLYFLDCINSSFETLPHPQVFNVEHFVQYDLRNFNKDVIEIILVTDSKEFVTRMKEMILLERA